MWKLLYQQLVASEGHELVRPPDVKIDAAFKKVESELDVKLPAGYKAFIHQFGPGELGGYFRIFGPPIAGFGDWGNDILEENKSWRDPDGAWATSGNPELVARLICFSTTIGGDAFFWDPDDVRGVRQHEYGTYILSHSSRDMKVKQAAGSFKEFIEIVCLGDGFPKLVGSKGWDEGDPPQRFLPAWQTKKARGS